MKKFIMTVMAVATLAAITTPAAARDVVDLLTQAPNRYLPSEVGKPVDLHYMFGPYVIPPGQDSNRITADIPVHDGFITAVAPDLIDATSGRVPTQQEAHIHHAHWFRVTEDGNQEYYASGLSWVFGTGEEKSQGRLDDRARLDHAALNDWDYGIQIDGTTPNGMIYMIHNKLPTVGHYYVVLDVTFIPGTRDEIKAATGRDIHPLYGVLWGQTKDVSMESRHAGPAIGARRTFTRGAVGVAAGGHLHPGGKVTLISNVGPDVTETLTDGAFSKDVTHSLCSTVSLNPDHTVSRTSIDPDGDGFEGVTILNSWKYEHDMRAWPYSEDYQIGTGKFGWRSPIHPGDVLVQHGKYALNAAGTSTPLNVSSLDGLDHNWYEAMTYAGIYMDRDQNAEWKTRFGEDLTTRATSCSVASLGARQLGADTFEQQGLSNAWLNAGADQLNPSLTDVKPELVASVNEIKEDWNLFGTGVTQGMVNHIWVNYEPLCAQAGLPDLTTEGPKGPALPACDQGVQPVTYIPGPVVDAIHVGGFLYTPGDLGTPINGQLILPRIEKGKPLTFINDDAALNVRHTFTSCAWPCRGTYVSNFPLPNGGRYSFDSGKIGNIDPIDGGLFNQGSDLEPFLRYTVDPSTGRQSDTVPVYTFDTSGLEIGERYSYFCRIHPFMRGGFEVVAPA